MVDNGKTIAVSRHLRRSYEAGHSPKFLVFVDDAEHCSKAVYYASRRAARVGAKVVLLRVIDPPPGELGWLGVGCVMESEARQEAERLLERYVILAHSISAGFPETVIREGDAAREIAKLIEADEDIAMLVLAAGCSSKGPGLLLSRLIRTAGDYLVPIVMVPAHLTNAELDALS
jgi:nucleotide-binding universal stress UspA family protein